MLLLGGSLRRLFGRLLDAVFAIEPLDAPRGIDQALCASIKGMALRANLDVKLFERRARFEGVAAGTDDSAAAVFRMDSSFHFCFSNSSAYCVAGYHRKVSRTIRPLRRPFRAFRIANRHLVRSNNNHDLRDCHLRRIFARETRAAPTTANAGFAPDSRTLFAPIVYLAPPGPARASRAIAILNRQLDFQRKISFHPKIGAVASESRRPAAAATIDHDPRRRALLEARYPMARQARRHASDLRRGAARRRRLSLHARPRIGAVPRNPRASRESSDSSPPGIRPRTTFRASPARSAAS